MDPLHTYRRVIHFIAKARQTKDPQLQAMAKELEELMQDVLKKSAEAKAKELGITEKALKKILDSIPEMDLLRKVVHRELNIKEKPPKKRRLSRKVRRKV